MPYLFFWLVFETRRRAISTEHITPIMRTKISRRSHSQTIITEKLFYSATLEQKLIFTLSEVNCFKDLSGSHCFAMDT